MKENFLFMKGEISFSIWISKSKAKEKSLFMDPEFMDPELWVLLHEKLPRELSWSESERELASSQEISLESCSFCESSFSSLERKEIFFFKREIVSLKRKERRTISSLQRKTSSYYSKFQSLASLYTNSASPHGESQKSKPKPKLWIQKIFLNHSYYCSRNLERELQKSRSKIQKSTAVVLENKFSKNKCFLY